MLQPSTLSGLALGTLFALAFTSSAIAGDAAAVSSLNGKAAFTGSYINQNNQSGSFGGLFLGSLTAPVTHDFGFQGDTVLGTQNGNEVAGIGGHFFWRDPTTGLVGLTASYLNINNHGANPNRSIARYGVEGEYYAGPFTVALTSGYQRGTNRDNGFYGSVTGYWYANDNLRLGIGTTHDPELTTGGTAGLEYQPRFTRAPGMTFFADVTAGERHYVNAQMGIRFYFGGGKNLKLRNREDDPISNLPGDSITSATYNPTPTSSGSLTPQQACEALGSFYAWDPVGKVCFVNQ